MGSARAVGAGHQVPMRTALAVGQPRVARDTTWMPPDPVPVAASTLVVAALREGILQRSA